MGAPVPCRPVTMPNTMTAVETAAAMPASDARAPGVRIFGSHVITARAAGTLARARGSVASRSMSAASCDARLTPRMTRA